MPLKRWLDYSMSNAICWLKSCEQDRSQKMTCMVINKCDVWCLKLSACRSTKRNCSHQSVTKAQFWVFFLIELLLICLQMCFFFYEHIQVFCHNWCMAHSLINLVGNACWTSAKKAHHFLPVHSLPIHAGWLRCSVFAWEAGKVTGTLFMTYSASSNQNIFTCALSSFHLKL